MACDCDLQQNVELDKWWDKQQGALYHMQSIMTHVYEDSKMGEIGVQIPVAKQMSIFSSGTHAPNRI